MEEIEVVIKIPKILYTKIQSDAKIMIYSGMRSWKGVLATLLRSVRNGTPLPKGHGDLVYREDVCNELRYMDNNGCITRSVNHVIEDIKKGVQTIIEADKEQ